VYKLATEFSLLRLLSCVCFPLTLIDGGSWLTGVQMIYLFLMFLYSACVAHEQKYYYVSEDKYGGRLFHWSQHLLLIGRHRDRVAGILMMLCVVSPIALRLSEIDGEALSILRYVPSVIMVSLGIYIEYRVGRRTSETDPAID
jgi:hypothetical protein